MSATRLVELLFYTVFLSVIAGGFYFADHYMVTCGAALFMLMLIITI